MNKRFFASNFLVGVVFLLFSSLVHATYVFDFTIDTSLATIVSNVETGDTFSFSFIDDSNFISGISTTDIETVGYDLAYLGQTAFNGSWITNTISFADVFNFTDLGSQWQLDLMLGVTGVNTALTNWSGGSDQMQIGTTVSGSGATMLAFWGGNGFAYMHNDQEPVTFTAYANKEGYSVPEPTTLTLMGIGLAGLRFSRRVKV